ncbi:ABC transporter permease [Xinfangfangia sp. D13-10-4-6]|uniref:ABC transporter permease n=1 Tax=Pseudogemmobacter hezensis TaxID=2737662 RepID=UPI001553B2FA|nr:ABC transporter permease [Pseudogemmobacter hezensis]NPD14627.1 ABC transporter permease [Pseudogemmobacter hezensis]
MSETNPPVPLGRIAAPSLKPARFPAFRSIGALVLREMSATYGRNPGGYVWAIVEPIGSIIMLSIGFALFMRAPPLGSNFVLFFATGFLPFTLYTSVTTKVQLALRYTKPLLTYPKVVWIDAILARLGLAILTEMTVMTIVITSILMVVKEQFLIDYVPIMQGLSILVIGAAGLGMINGLIAAVFPLWPTLWGILNRPIFLASGVVFLYDSMPVEAQAIMWWNPILQAVALVRSGFYSSYHADFVSLTYCYALGMIVLAVGLLVMRKWHKIALER